MIHTIKSIVDEYNKKGYKCSKSQIWDLVKRYNVSRTIVGNTAIVSEHGKKFLDRWLVTYLEKKNRKVKK